MDKLYFQSSSWYHATTLTERITSLRSVCTELLNGKVNAKIAEPRIQRWCSQAPFATGSYFEQRLTIDGMTKNEFLYLLGEPIEAIRSRFSKTPDWMIEIAQAFSRPASFSFPLLLEECSNHENAGFLDAIEPLISQGRERLHTGVQLLIETYATLPFDPNTIEGLLFANLPEQLLSKLSRTMVLELHIARLQGFVHGDTPEERFQNFLQRLHQKDIALALLQEYPVLARQLLICIEQWVTFSLEFLHHLCEDWDTIRATFIPKDEPGLLVQLNGNLGDKHRRGRAVLKVKFRSGFQLIYKPRSVAVEMHFQELLAWVNDRGDHPPFRTIKVLERGTYGWCEFIAYEHCTSLEDVWRFYERQGGYIALLYALAGVDINFENVIASGEHPVLIDLEALFHPQFGNIENEEVDRLASHNLVEHSVISTGLLPRRLLVSDEYEGIDLSGLGGQPGQFRPISIPHLEGAGTDEMRFCNKQQQLHESRNRPCLNGNQVNVLDYTEAIVSGFTEIYHLLLNHRNDMLSPKGPLARFAEDEVRVLIRPTAIYNSLLNTSFHPDLLRNALDRDRHFDKVWMGVEYHPDLVRVIAAEREDLQQGDIPIFATRPSSWDIWNSSHERIANFLNEPGMIRAQRRVQQLSEHDLQQQIWFIRASLTTLVMDAHQPQLRGYSLTEPQIIADQAQLLTAAQAIGDRLEELALRGEQDVSWIGLAPSKHYWFLAPLKWPLYDGISGVALFLAYLGTITLEERYIILAQGALTNMQRQIKQRQSKITQIGGFNGWGSVIYTLTHLGVLWNQSTLLAEAEAIVEFLPTLIDQDESLDILSGAAGCIGSLISLYRCVPSERTLAAAIQCGERLITVAQSMEQGIGWISSVSTKPLSGFSHGVAGIAWALLELAALSGQERFRATALSAIDYERSLFCPTLGNWFDLREHETSDQVAKDKKDVCKISWCHGAAGIGLARLRSLQYLDDAQIRTEIDTALKTTLIHGFGQNHSLCHGDLGNIEMLLQASEMLDDSQWRSQLERVTAIILESMGRYGWLCGVPLGVESPGLMTGLAGIGYGLLRLAAPSRIPSVLVLAPPPLQRG